MLDFTIHHISINVSNLANSLNFYYLLGFVEYHKFCSSDDRIKIIHLLKDKFILELFHYSVAPTTKTIPNNIEHSSFVGIDHFSLQTTKIEGAYKKLSEYVLPENNIQMGRTGIRFFFTNDPDGNRIEIVEDKRNLNNIKQ